MQIQVHTRVAEARVCATIAADSVAANHNYRHLTNLQHGKVMQQLALLLRHDSPFPEASCPDVDALAPRELVVHLNPNLGQERSKMEQDENQ